RYRDAEVVGEIEHLQAAPLALAVGQDAAHERIVELGEVEAWPRRAVVPPQGTGIALDQFEEALEDGFLQRAARGAAIGIGAAEGVALLRIGERRVEIAEVAIACRQPAKLSVGQRPG